MRLPCLVGLWALILAPDAGAQGVTEEEFLSAFTAEKAAVRALGEGTPAHGHPLLTSAVAPIPGKLLLRMGAMVGDAPEVVAPATPGRLLWQSGSTHDPPGGLETASVLRI